MLVALPLFRTHWTIFYEIYKRFSNIFQTILLHSLLNIFPLKIYTTKGQTDIALQKNSLIGFSLHER